MVGEIESLGRNCKKSVKPQGILVRKDIVFVIGDGWST